MTPQRAVRAWMLVAAVAAMVAGAAAEEPDVAHQPSPCTVPGQPISLCASVTDDGQVAKVRIYFRPAGEKFYSFVEMAFTGINFCGTLPAPREKKTQAIDYYVQGVDDEYATKRTSTYQLNIQPEGVCEFPPIEKDASKTKAITVYATSAKQGKKLPGAFQSTGVTFVPVKTK
jgi:hypothetical protein